LFLVLERLLLSLSTWIMILKILLRVNDKKDSK
jgi:hypothetical protein